MRTSALNLVLLVTLAAAVYAVAVRIIEAPAHSDASIAIPYSNKEGKPVLAAVSAAPPIAKSARTDIPPIDAAAPATVETATFALG